MCDHSWSVILSSEVFFLSRAKPTSWSARISCSGSVGSFRSVPQSFGGQLVWFSSFGGDHHPLPISMIQDRWEPSTERQISSTWVFVLPVFRSVSLMISLV